MRQSIHGWHFPNTIVNKYSLLMHRIKIKSPANFLWTEQNNISYQSALTLMVLQWQKSLSDIGGTTIQDVGPLAHMEPGVHTMNNELILQISCNIFLAFKWILMMKFGHNISHYMTAKLSVHCEIMTWSDDKTKSIHKNFYKNTITSS